MNLRSWRHFDFALLAATLFLAAYGTLLIYSGSHSGAERGGSIIDSPVTKQAAFALLGLVAMLAVSRLDYRFLRNIAWSLYALSIVALVAVLFAPETFGSRRWFSVGPMQIQPAEMAKLATIITLARYLGAKGPAVRTWRVFLTSFAIAALPATLVFLEPDLGTATIFMAIWLGIVAMAGVRFQHLGLFAAGAALLIPFGMVGAMTEYQRERIQLFLDPASDPLGSGFNILQAQISIGSGGFFGKGLLHGTQTQLDYLRTQTTDYVFSVLGEELGFFGAMILFGLFIFLLFRGIRAAGMAKDGAGRLMATGIVVMIAVQAFINIGVNLSIFPVTGVPLPLISQGGSSLVSVFVALGLIEGIVLRHRPIEF